jgi:hypothetical protein
LAKLARRRIPRTIVPISGPAEAGIETVQYPNWFAEGTGQMRNRRIDADDEIEVVDQGCRIGKIVKIFREIVHFHAARRTSRLERRWTCLQRDKLYPRYVAKCPQRVETQRAAAIDDNLAQVARSPPSLAQSDPQAAKTGEPLAPVSNVRRVCGQIGRRCGNGFDRGADGIWQAHQGAP